MKNFKLSFLISVLLITAASCSGDAETLSPMGSEIPEDIGTQATRTKQDVSDILREAINAGNVITGQHCGDGLDQTASFYGTYVEELEQETGKYVGIIGADVGFMDSPTFPIQTLVAHWKEGGLVSISWHADNPFTQGFSFRENSVENNSGVDFKALLKNAPTSQAQTNYRSELDKVAKVLERLQDEGVVVLWRPFHEMNGDWFWWGINAYNNNQTNESDYVLLWKDMYETFTIEYGLENLLWTYAAAEFFGWNAEVLAYYPGNDYVDIVGIDYYGVTPNFPEFEKLEATGKITALTEAGPASQVYGNWDELELLNSLKGKASYFLQWHSWPGAEVAIINNENASAMMNNANAITREDLAR